MNWRIYIIICAADQQLRAADAPEAGPAEQLHARALQPWCLLTWRVVEDESSWFRVALCSMKMRRYYLVVDGCLWPWGAQDSHDRCVG
jgi:hypothetical protein